MNKSLTGYYDTAGKYVKRLRNKLGQGSAVFSDTTVLPYIKNVLHACTLTSETVYCVWL